MTDLEAAGALATAGLMAREIDGNRGAGAGHEAEHGHAHPCANCQTELKGSFCHACGQSAHIHNSLLHLAEEIAHGVLHFDAKGWRTLPLLVFRPGVLTRRYLDGQRVRYVSPLALFLFTVFMMFFVFSFTGGHGASALTGDVAQMTEARTELQSAVDEAQARLDEANRNIEEASEEGAVLTMARAADRRGDAEKELRAAQTALVAFDQALAAKKEAEAAQAHKTDAAEPAETSTPADGQSHAPEAPADAESPMWARNIRNMGMQLDTGNPELDGKLRHKLENPELLLYKLKNTAYKFSFMLIPISLPFLWLMFFWKRGVTLYDHAVFSLYSLSFMSLLFIVTVLLSMTPYDVPYATLMFIVPSVHMFLQLRGTYQLSNWGALWRTFALQASAGTAFLLFLSFIFAVVLSG
jgi:hypothetical protein